METVERLHRTYLGSLAIEALTTGGVTKSTKIVVAADPDSMSGKAAKARQYSLPIVSEDAFERLFDDYRNS